MASLLFTGCPALCLGKATKKSLFTVNEGVYNFPKSNSQVYNFAYKLHSIHIAPQEYYVPPMPKTKKTHGKSLFFPGELGNG